MVFAGTYEHSIDAKGRLAIPSEIRGMLGRGGSAQPETPFCWYVTLGEDRTLCLYTEEGFEKRADELDRSSLDADQLLRYERLMFSLAQRVEMDRNGRIRLPEQLLRMTELGNDVVLIGVKDHLEVRDRQNWYAERDRMLQQEPGVIMNPRRAMQGE